MKSWISNRRPGTILGVIAIVLALTGTAVAKHGHDLKLGMFDQSSRDRLAGSGVIQYAAQTHTTGALSMVTPQEFTVNCELAKKSSSGGFKWEGAAPPPSSYKYLDGHPTAQGFKVRLYVLEAAAVGKQVTVFSNCVKSRVQRGTAPN